MREGMVDGGGRWESGREGKKGGREERKAGHTYIIMVSLWSYWWEWPRLVVIAEREARQLIVQCGGRIWATNICPATHWNAIIAAPHVNYALDPARVRI